MLDEQNAFADRVLEQPELWIKGSIDDLPLEALAGPGRALRSEPPDAREFANHLRSAEVALRDAQHEELSLETRFFLACRAAYSLCLAALRYRGFRPANRIIVFQALPHTLGTRDTDVWRVLAKAHQVRNASEYEGESRVEVRLLRDLMNAVLRVKKAVEKLPPLA